MVGARQLPRRRSDERARDRQPRAPRGRRVHRATLQGSGAEAGRNQRLLPAGAVPLAQDRRGASRAWRWCATARRRRWCSATRRPSACASSRRRQVDAPMVFAGYGLQVPESKHDDLAGLDLNGKVVAAAHRRAVEHPGAAARALPERALGVPEAGRRDRRRLDSEPEGPGHPVGSFEARALPAVDGDCRSRAGRDRRPAAGGNREPGDGGEVLRGQRPHVQGTARRSPTRARCCRASPSRHRSAPVHDRCAVAQLRQRHRRPARHRPGAEERVHRRLVASRSHRRRHPGGRCDLQRRDGQRVGDRDADRSGARGGGEERASSGR